LEEACLEAVVVEVIGVLNREYLFLVKVGTELVVVELGLETLVQLTS
jgi:hypothetical protein